MWVLYDLIIHLYGYAIRIAALFNAKARAWVDGRKGEFRAIESSVVSRQSVVSQESITRCQRMTADRRPPTADRRPPTADRRP